jgi:hypothetical protein
MVQLEADHPYPSLQLEPESVFTWQLQVVELKVGMHCDRCIKSIKKAIKTIDGRESFDPLNS